MISHERAEEMLKGFEVSDRSERVVKAVSSLPQPLREAAFGILYLRHHAAAWRVACVASRFSPDAERG